MLTDRLQRVFVKLEQLPPTIQDEVAEQLEEWVEFPHVAAQNGYKSLAGAWANLPDGDEMIDILDQLRHSSVPTPPLEVQDF
jgi:hypothetical protein